MKISSIKVYPMRSEKKLRAFVSVTFDDFMVIHDIKIVETEKGVTLVCMPAKRSRVECLKCKAGVDSDSLFCKYCGASVPVRAGEYDPKKDHRDIVHPVSREARAYIVDEVLKAYKASQN